MWHKGDEKLGLTESDLTSTIEFENFRVFFILPFLLIDVYFYTCFVYTLYSENTPYGHS